MSIINRLTNLKNSLTPGPQAKEEAKRELNAIALASLKELVASLGCVGIAALFISKAKPIERSELFRMAILPVIKNLFLRGLESLCQYQLNKAEPENFSSRDLDIRFLCEVVLQIARFKRHNTFAKLFEGTIGTLIHELGHAFFAILFCKQLDLKITLYPPQEGRTILHQKNFSLLEELMVEMQSPKPNLIKIRYEIEKISASTSDLTRLGKWVENYFPVQAIIKAGGFLFALTTMLLCFIAQSLYLSRSRKHEFLDYVVSIGSNMIEHNSDYAKYNGFDAKFIENNTGIPHQAIRAGLLLPTAFMQALLMVNRAMTDLKNFEKQVGLPEPTLNSIAMSPKEQREPLFDHENPFQSM
jgi:hypothetical protein